MIVTCVWSFKMGLAKADFQSSHHFVLHQTLTEKLLYYRLYNCGIGFFFIENSQM